MRLIWETVLKIVVEPSCAVPLAAVIFCKIAATIKTRIAAKGSASFFSGGNVDLDKALKLFALMFEHYSKTAASKKAFTFISRPAIHRIHHRPAEFFPSGSVCSVYHFIAGLSWIDSLLNAAMILTGMGSLSTRWRAMDRNGSLRFMLYSVGGRVPQYRCCLPVPDGASVSAPASPGGRLRENEDGKSGKKTTKKKKPRGKSGASKSKQAG